MHLWLAADTLHRKPFRWHRERGDGAVPSCAVPDSSRRPQHAHEGKERTVGGADAEVVPAARRLRQRRQVHLSSRLRHGGMVLSMRSAIASCCGGSATIVCWFVVESDLIADGGLCDAGALRQLGADAIVEPALQRIGNETSAPALQGSRSCGACMEPLQLPSCMHAHLLEVHLRHRALEDVAGGLQELVCAAEPTAQRVRDTEVCCIQARGSGGNRDRQHQQGCPHALHDPLSCFGRRSPVPAFAAPPLCPCLPTLSNALRVQAQLYLTAFPPCSIIMCPVRGRRHLRDQGEAQASFPPTTARHAAQQ